MKRFLAIGAATVVAAVPAIVGLAGNASFAQDVPVRVPAGATVVADRTPHAEPSDDRGGRTPHAEPSDDRGGGSRSGSGSGSGPGSGHGGSGGGSDDGPGHG
jgi:hypothetical protein